MVESPKGSGSPPAAAFPDEPFACPHCGQMLASSCRVCPSCKQAIDPNDIARPDVTIPIATQVIPLPAKENARFSWSMFFATLGTWLVVAFVTEGLLGYEKSQFVLIALVALSSAWVLHDAREKNIPKPWRWSIGSCLLWMIIFPWYLARRKTPNAPCPFIEGEGGRVARTVLFILLFFFLLSALMLLLRGPAHPPAGGKKPGTKGTQAPSGKIATLTNSVTSQRSASPPSEAFRA